MKERLQKIECFLFDMDGTIYLGEQLLPGARETLELLTTQGKQYYFLTNNSSRDQEHYRQKLSRMGINTVCERIIISTHSAINYLYSRGFKNLFVLGTAELKSILAGAGYNVVARGCPADCVLVGFDLTLNYENLAAACQYIDGGLPYIATHPDVRCPLDGGRYLPDCGSIVALIKAATGKDCEMVTGKPSRYMLDAVLQATGFSRARLAIVGDRLYTDIALGQNNGVLSVLLLSGETGRADLAGNAVQPDITLAGMAELAKLLAG